VREDKENIKTWWL